MGTIFIFMYICRDNSQTYPMEKKKELRAVAMFGIQLGRRWYPLKLGNAMLKVYLYIELIFFMVLIFAIRFFQVQSARSDFLRIVLNCKIEDIHMYTYHCVCLF